MVGDDWRRKFPVRHLGKGADLRLNEHSHHSWPESKLERWKNDAACATCLLVRGLGPRGKGSNDTVNEAHSFKHLERELSRDILHEAEEYEYGIRNGRRSTASGSLGIRG